MSNKIFAVVFASAVIVIFICCTSEVKAQKLVSDGLIAFWTFDNSDVEGETVKDVFGDNDGTIAGNPRIVDGKIDEALEFDGAGDYVDLGNARDFDLPIATVECWFRTSSDAEMRIFAPGAGFTNKWFLSLNESGYIAVSRSSTASQNQQTTNSFNDGQWHHVVGITATNAADIEIYVDGVLEPSTTIAEEWSTSGDCKIGAKSGGEYLFSGIIDEVRIYDKALTEDEVEQNYEAQSQSFAVEPAKKLAITWGEAKMSDWSGNR